MSSLLDSIEDDLTLVGEFFLDDATSCLRLFANLESKLVLMVLAFGRGEGVLD